MKQFTKLMAMLLFTAATQYSCINDADVISDKTHSDSNGNVALFLEIPNVPVSRSAESSGVTEEGSKEEYAVKSLTVYFFDSVTKTLLSRSLLKTSHWQEQADKNTIHRQQNHNETGNLQCIRHRQW